MNNEDKTILESLVDKHDLNDVIVALSEICYEKAEHIRSNWNDAASARTWVSAANYLMGCAVNTKIVDVSK